MVLHLLKIKNALEYDKMGQVHWLVDEMRDKFRSHYNIYKFLIIDELMIGYKRKYCPAYQYMPKKFQKGEIKVWCLANSYSKYVYFFKIYSGRNGDGDSNVQACVREEGTMACGVVMSLLGELHGKEHVVVTNNYFSSVGLFTKLASLETYAIGIVKAK